MARTIFFQPWSSFSGCSRTRRDEKQPPRPAPKCDQPRLHIDKDGRPCGAAIAAWDPNRSFFGAGHGPLGAGHGPLGAGHGGLGGQLLAAGHGGLGGDSRLRVPSSSGQYLQNLARITGGGAGRVPVGLGYMPDLPDCRDDGVARLREGFEEREKFRKKDKKASSTSRFLGTENVPHEPVHLGDEGLFGPVEDQLDIGSCTANAVIGMVEYFLRKDANEELDMSRMFLYHCARRLMGVTGDTGSYIRTTIKSLRLFGVPPESRWPYHRDLLDVEPDPFTFSYAQNFRALKYATLDAPGTDLADVRIQVKQAIADGNPVAFGFTVFKSIEAMTTPIIPFPISRNDAAIGGHAVLAVGFDDSIQYTYPDPDKEGSFKEDQGALIIRNSWGESWGDLGYGYLPYRYLDIGLAQDFWTVYTQDWVKLLDFGDDQRE